MMDKSAIDTLIDIGATRDGLIGKTFIPSALIPKTCEVVNLENFLEAPIRMRATFRTERLEDFAAYVREQGDTNETAIFIQSAGSGAKAVIDYGSDKDPLWGDHKAILSIPATPEADAIQRICCRPHSQRELIEFMEDWGHILNAESSSEETIGIKKAIAAIRAVTIDSIRKLTNEEADFETSQSALEKISAKSSKGALPAKLIATASLLEGLEPTLIELRVSILTGEDRPMFRVRFVAEEKLRQAAAKEVEARIQTDLAGTRIFVGEI